MAIDPYANCNLNITINTICTLQTCCLAQSPFLYLPSYGGNLFFAVFFGVLMLPQLGLSIYYRTWGFGVGIVSCLILEVIGYAARVQLAENPFDNNPFLMYLITLTIAPVFITAVIYLSLNRIIGVYGQHLSRFQPRTIAISFISSDFLSLVLQAVGGAIADTANDSATSRIGADIMVAGLVLQSVSLATFMGVCADFANRCRTGVLNSDVAKQQRRNTLLFKLFLVGLGLATVTILIRSIFRAAELWQGFNGSIWNNETEFMILDGAMVSIAAVSLTVVHPGFTVGAQWHASNWSFKTGKKPAKDAGSPPSGERQYSEDEMKAGSTV